MSLPANLCFQTAGCQQSCSYQSLCLKQTETEKKILNLETWSYFKYIILVTQIYKLQSHLYKSESSQSILPFQFLVSSTHFIYVRQDFVDVLHTALASQQVFQMAEATWSYYSPFWSQLALNVHLWIYFYFRSFKVCTQ